MDLDPAVSTLLKIARCHQHEGKLARAWYDYQRARKLNRESPGVSETRRAELEGYAREAAAALEPRLPKLRIVLAEPVAGVRVLRDGQELPVTALGEALPADPGEHEIVASAPGRVETRQKVALVEGQLAEIQLTLAHAPRTPAANAGPPPDAAGGDPRLATPAPDAAPPGAGRRTAGLVVGAVGLTGLLAAGVLGAVTVGKVGESGEHCTPDDVCQPKGVTLRDEARTTQTFALVLLGVGVTALGAGVVLYATAPRAEVGAPVALRRVELAASPAALLVRARF